MSQRWCVSVCVYWNRCLYRDFVRVIPVEYRSHHGLHRRVRFDNYPVGIDRDSTVADLVPELGP